MFLKPQPQISTCILTVPPTSLSVVTIPYSRQPNQLHFKPFLWKHHIRLNWGLRTCVFNFWSSIRLEPHIMSHSPSWQFYQQQLMLYQTLLNNSYLWHKPLLFSIKGHMRSDVAGTCKSSCPTWVPLPETLTESVLHIWAQLSYYKIQIFPPAWYFIADHSCTMMPSYTKCTHTHIISKWVKFLS